MGPLAELLAQTKERFADAHVPFALVGGLAVGARVEPRFTRDVDVAVVVADDAGAERVVRTLAPPMTARTLVEHDELGRLATARLSAAGGPHEVAEPMLDVIFASCGIEREIVEQAETIEVFPAVAVPVAVTGHLIAMKLLSQRSARPQDHVDLVGLIAIATSSDLDVVRTAVNLIAERGANRGRDLHKALSIELNRALDDQ